MGLRNWLFGKKIRKLEKDIDYLKNQIHSDFNLQEYYKTNNIKLHKNVSLPSEAYKHQVIIEQDVEIGENTYISYRSIVFQKVKIGRYCSISTGVLMGVSAHPTDWLTTFPLPYNRVSKEHQNYKEFKLFQDTIIGNDVWIGANVIIKSGVTIGDGAIIGSGAIVTKDIPPYAITVGAPAKVIKYRFSNDTIKELMDLKWWDLDIEDLKKNKIDFNDINKAIGQIKQIKLHYK